MIDRQRKIKKTMDWLKRSRVVPQKTKFGQKYKWFKISHVESFFWKYYFRHTSCLYKFQWISSEFFLMSDFLTESLKAIKNYWKRSLILQYNFAQKTSLISRISAHLTLCTICSRNTTKTRSAFANILDNIFLFSVWNNICTAQFLDAQEPHSWCI